jgi:16S rRNA (uracil1498-N3)-methyltransferase
VSARRVFLPPAAFTRGRAALTPEARHHLVEVLRLAEGAAVEVFDGRGGAWDGTLAAGLAEVKLGPRREVPAPGVEIRLVVALARGEKMDLVVQKATELGATAIAPFEAERSVVRLLGDGERGAERGRRWRRIAEEAARQCGRADVPEVAPPVPLEAALAAVPAGFALHLFHVGGPPAAARGDAASPPGARAMGHALVVGPEGGLTDDEVARCLRAGARPASLGPRILRAETAAIVAVALVQALRGDMAGGFLDPVPSRP